MATISRAASYGWIVDPAGNEIGSQDTRLNNIASSTFFGDNVTVGEGVMVDHSSHIECDSILLGGVAIGSDVYLGLGSCLEADVEIGDHATLIEDNRVGKAAVIGAGVILTKDICIPERSHIGPNVVVPAANTLAVLGEVGPGKLLFTIYGSARGAIINVDGHEYNYREFVHQSGIWPDLSPAERHCIGTAYASVQRNYAVEAKKIARLQRLAARLRK